MKKVLQILKRVAINSGHASWRSNIMRLPNSRNIQKSEKKMSGGLQIWTIRMLRLRHTNAVRKLIANIAYPYSIR
jgi:hypothetical protein